MSEKNDQETLLEFPCQFPIKAMGHKSDEFEAHVLEIMRRHCPDLGEGAVRLQDSASGKYISITCTVTATCQEHLDAIYQELTDSDQVVVAL